MGRKLTTKILIERARTIHGEIYDYSPVKYMGYKIKINIICSKHQVFQKSPNDLLGGSGCPKCGFEASAKTRRSTKQQFIQQAKIIHNNLYDYSAVVYKNNHTSITIICSTHGRFVQTPNNHLSKKHQCPQCSSSNTSILENLWIDDFDITSMIKQKYIYFDNKSYYKADGYDPVTNTVYEFWGDFWHGNPDIYNSDDINPVNGKTFGELYEATQIKIQKYKSYGYNINSIWENDFLSI